MNRPFAVGIRGAMLLMLALSDRAALAQNPPSGTPGGGTSGAAGSGSGAASTPAGPERFFEKKVSVDADSLKLVEVLPKLLKSVGADYIIEADVKNALVTGHLTGVKFQTALDLLMRVSNIPVEYRYEDGMFRFVKHVEPPAIVVPPAPDEDVLPPPPKQGEAQIGVHEVDTENLIRALTGGDPSVLPPPPPGSSNGSYTGHSHTSSFGFSSSGVQFGSSGNQQSSQGGSGSSQTSGGGATITLFGHTFRIGNGGPTNGSGGRNGSSGGRSGVSGPGGRH